MPVAPALAFGAKSYGRSPPEHTHTHAHKFIHRHPSLCMHVYALRIFILFIYIDVTYLKNKIKIILNPRFHLTWFYANFSPKSVKSCQNIRIYLDARIPQSQPKTIVSWWKPIVFIKQKWSPDMSRPFFRTPGDSGDSALSRAKLQIPFRSTKRVDSRKGALRVDNSLRPKTQLFLVTLGLVEMSCI